MKNRILFPVVLSLLWLPTMAAAAGFARVGTYGFTAERLFPGATSSALGYADVAAPAGPFSILQNPAAPLEGPDVQLGFDRANYVADMDVHNWAALVQSRRHGLRFCLVRHEMTAEGPIRTAYNPEGTGDFFKNSDQAYSVGLAWDLAPYLPDNDPWSMTVGASWRHYRSRWETLADSETDADDLNLGLTVCYQWHLDNGWLKAVAATMVHNALHGSLSFDGRESDLPRYCQLGFALTWGLQAPAQEVPSLSLQLAYGRMAKVDSYSYSGAQASRWGLELSCFDVLDLRLGDADKSLPLDNSNTWGLGLRTPRSWLGDFRVEANWAQLELDPLMDHLQVWGVTLGRDF